MSTNVVPLIDSEVHLTDVLLLCTECGEPIKGRINTQQWIRVEWIGPEGECLKCYQEKKAKNETTNAQG